MAKYKILGELSSGAPGSPRYFPGSVWELPDDETTTKWLADGVIEAAAADEPAAAPPPPAEPTEAWPTEMEPDEPEPEHKTRSTKRR